MGSKPAEGKKGAGFVSKKFVTGTATDENTVKNSFVFFGSLLIVFFMSFIVSLTTSAAGGILRIAIGAAVIVLALYVFFNRGNVHGTEAVTRGEIVWQKEERGQTAAEAEKRVCYHPLKAFLIGFLGTLPFIVAAFVLAMNTKIMTTTAGTLPSWLQGYLRRDEVAGPLAAYTQSTAMNLTDILRIVIRFAVMPFINLVGSSDYAGVYTVEKLSPLLLMMPACAYGAGYLCGPGLRARVHTAISENNRKRIRKEKRERRIRTGISAKPKETKRLN